MATPTIGERVLHARDRLIAAESAVRNASIRYSDVDPLAVELFTARGALDAIEDVWQAQMEAARSVKGGVS